jgi:hypothetical protein
MFSALHFSVLRLWVQQLSVLPVSSLQLSVLRILALRLPEQPGVSFFAEGVVSFLLSRLSLPFSLILCKEPIL